jgi:hypothetical protein
LILLIFFIKSARYDLHKLCLGNPLQIWNQTIQAFNDRVSDYPSHFSNPLTLRNIKQINVPFLNIRKVLLYLN